MVAIVVPIAVVAIIVSVALYIRKKRMAAVADGQAPPVYCNPCSRPSTTRFRDTPQNQVLPVVPGGQGGQEDAVLGDDLGGQGDQAGGQEEPPQAIP